MRVPAPPGAVPGRREAPGARGPCEFSLRRDPSSASRPYPGSPFWGLVLWHRKRKDGFRWLRDSHAHHPPPRLLCPPNLRRRAHASQEASRTSAPSWGQPRMQKKRTVQVTESRAHGSPGGDAKEVVSCERPRSPTPPPPPRLAACLASRLLPNRVPTAGGLFYRAVRLARTPVSESHH